MWASMVVIGLLGGWDASAGELRKLKKQALQLRVECHDGQVDRCMDLADMTRHGHGMDADKGGAAALYRQGCASGHARGCVGLADLIIGGEVKGNRKESIENLRLTCSAWDGSHEALQPLQYLEAQAVTMSCINRADLFRQAGKKTRARQLYRKACAHDLLGCFSAAALLPQDQEGLAKSLTARACGMDEVSQAPTQVVGRVEMERGCHSLRMTGALPDNFGLSEESSKTADPREGEKVPTVVGTDVLVKKMGELKPSKEQDLGSHVAGTCRLHLVIDEKGKPYDVRVSACPQEAQDVVEASGWKWRFEPVMVDGAPSRAQFELDVDVAFGTGSAELSEVPAEEVSAEVPPETAPPEEAPPEEAPPEEAPADEQSPVEEAPTTEEPAPVEEAPVEETSDE